MVSAPNVRFPNTDARVLYEVDADESLSNAVLRAAGEVVDDLTDVRPLSSIVDVEALDQLFEHRRDTDEETHIVAFAAWNLWFVVTPAAVKIYELDDPLDG